MAVVTVVTGTSDEWLFVTVVTVVTVVTAMTVVTVVTVVTVSGDSEW
jgi:hypothetical protein